MFLIDVCKAHIMVRQAEPVVSGAVSIYQCRFDFTADWEGLDRTAVFRAGDLSRSVILDGANTCGIPWEVLSQAGCYLYVGVIGTRDGDVVQPTAMVPIGNIVRGTESADRATPPTPEVYDQILAAANQAAADAASVREAAANGEFNGDTGPQGPQGEKGDKGEKGNRGLTGSDGADGTRIYAHAGTDAFVETEAFVESTMGTSAFTGYTESIRNGDYVLNAGGNLGRITKIDYNYNAYEKSIYVKQVRSIVGPKGDPYVLTAADKTSIVNAVIAALPVYNGEVVA